MKSIANPLARAAIIVAAMAGSQLAAQAQTQEMAKAGPWRITYSPQVPNSCSAVMKNTARNPGDGQFFSIVLTGRNWELWTDKGVNEQQATEISVESETFPVTFEQNESVATARVGRNVINAMRTASFIDLALDDYGPQIELKSVSKAIDLLEKCVRRSAAAAVEEEPQPQPADEGIRWVRLSDGALDRGAPPSGRDTNGAPLFVCSADFNGGQQPGKIRRGFNGCNFAFGGREMTSPTYSLMVGRAKWARASGGRVPRNALQSGSEPNGEPLFVCRTKFNDSIQLGKIRPGFSGCNFSYGGNERTADAYEVMY